MALTKYCFLEEVRAVLGVNDLELADSTLQLPIYEIGLIKELSKIAAALPGAFSTAVALDEGTRSPLQQAFIDSVRLFASASVAVQAGTPLGMFAPRSLSDGKSSFDRFTDSPYKDALARAAVLVEEYRTDLAAAYAALTGGTVSSDSTVPRTFSVVVPRRYDPVTGVGGVT